MTVSQAIQELTRFVGDPDLVVVLDLGGGDLSILSEVKASKVGEHIVIKLLPEID